MSHGGVRAKFKCIQVLESTDSGGPKSIQLGAVVDDSPENKEFFRWTPYGRIEIGCVNEAASKKFEVGREYYVDFTQIDSQH